MDSAILLATAMVAAALMFAAVALDPIIAIAAAVVALAGIGVVAWRQRPDANPRPDVGLRILRGGGHMIARAHRCARRAVTRL
jgi:hypothetical protein